MTAEAVTQLRLPAQVLEVHALRMRRIGAVLLAASIIVGVGAPLVSLFLGFMSAASIAGSFVAIDMLVRARRGLAQSGALELTFTGRRVTAAWEGQPPHLVDEPLLGGQAFPDHLQLVAGEVTRRLFQLELPLSAEARTDFLARARTLHGLALPERRAVGVNLAIIFTVVPAGLAVLLVAVSIVEALVLVGVVAGLKSLPAELLLLALGGLVLVSLAVVVQRVARARA